MLQCVLPVGMSGSTVTSALCIPTSPVCSAQVDTGPVCPSVSGGALWLLWCPVLQPSAESWTLPAWASPRAHQKESCLPGNGPVCLNTMRGFQERKT